MLIFADKYHESVTQYLRISYANIQNNNNMTKNNEDILNKIYSGTKKGELIKKKKQLVESYLYKYGNLILECKLKPTPVIENLAKEFGLTRAGVTNILRREGVYAGRFNPVIFPKK